MLVLDNYAFVMLPEILQLNPYRQNEFPKLKTQYFNKFVLLTCTC